MYVDNCKKDFYYKKSFKYLFNLTIVAAEL